MIVMPSNNTSGVVHYWAGRYGNLGHLYSPQRLEDPKPHLPYCLDNGAYYAFSNKRPWDEKAFLAHVNRYAYLHQRPRWIVVPDVVADWPATLRNWISWAPRLKKLAPGIDLAMAVQDGAHPGGVFTAIRLAASELGARQWDIYPDIIFVGGSTEWKWATVPHWCINSARVHVGRVNTAKYLEICQAAGAESCDGTGWFRGRPEQIEELGLFLMRQAGMNEPQHVCEIVRGSRLKHKDQLCIPLEVA